MEVRRVSGFRWPVVLVVILFAAPVLMMHEPPSTMLAGSRLRREVYKTRTREQCLVLSFLKSTFDVM